MTIMRSIAFGALAGLCTTMTMTAVMRRLHEALPAEERYPLPPREITDRALPAVARPDGATASLLAHFGYGALTGALYACLPPGRLPGVIYGPAVWAASYFGWLPASGILKPAHEHPGRRNALMVVAHVVWGGALALSLDELHRAARGGFGRGSRPDADGRP